MRLLQYCKECGQTFLSSKGFNAHVNRYLQKHLDEYTPKKKTPWEAFSNIPEGMNRSWSLKSIVWGTNRYCLWRNGYLSSALRERSRELELQARLSEWLKE